MDKLKIWIGLVYTQLMFCDEHGKLQFHRVMTDTDRPWISIKEVLRMVKQALCMDKPIGYNPLMKSVHIDIQYWGINFSSILQTLRKEMKRYLSEDCELSIQTIKDYEENVEENPRKEMDEWEARVWEFGPLEAIDRNDTPDYIQMLWDQTEQDISLISSDYDRPLHNDKSYQSFKERSKSCKMLIEDQISILFINGGLSNWERENNLRGSPNVIPFDIKKRGGCTGLNHKLIVYSFRDMGRPCPFYCWDKVLCRKSWSFFIFPWYFS